MAARTNSNDRYFIDDFPAMLADGYRSVSNGCCHARVLSSYPMQTFASAAGCWLSKAGL
jgi:hypothetical protein